MPVDFGDQPALTFEIYYLPPWRGMSPATSHSCQTRSTYTMWVRSFGGPPTVKHFIIIIIIKLLATLFLRGGPVSRMSGHLAAAYAVTK